MLKPTPKNLENQKMSKHKLNPYNAGGPPSKRNPYTKGSAKSGRQYGFETKSDKPSPSGLKGDKPKKY